MIVGIRAPAVLVVAAGAIVAVPFAVEGYWLGIVTQGLIFALAAASLDLLLGTTGMASLGHAAYFGLGGYGVGIAAVRYELAPGAAVAFGVALAFVGALVFGLLAVRSRGIYFLVITLAIGQLLWGIAIKWIDVTGGYNGLPGIRRPTPFGIELVTSRPHFYFVAALVALGLLALWLIKRSPVGLVLRGIRSSELRTGFLGYRTDLYRLFAFTAAGTFAGLAGALNALHLRFVGPDSLFWSLSALLVLMVVIGGAGTLWGPVIAAIGLVLFQEWVSSWTDRWVFVLGVLYIATICFAPDGLIRAAQELAHRTRRAVSRATPGATSPTEPAPTQRVEPLRTGR